MVSIRGILARLSPITRGERIALVLGLALVVAFVVSLVEDPSPLLAWLLGAALVLLIVVRTLFAMGWRLDRE